MATSTLPPDPSKMEETRNLLQKKLAEVLRRAHLACDLAILSTPVPSDGRPYCNATFDGWGCWNYTLAGETAYIQCPEFIKQGQIPEAMAIRHCEENGTWQVHEGKGEAWSNYSQCYGKGRVIQSVDSDPRNFIYFFIAGYSVSIVALVISLFIFFLFRQLRCERITIHKNLFASYVLTGSTMILYYSLAALDGHVLLQNPVWCQILHVAAQYFTVCNFAWMFCEGLYLHTIMVHAFRTGKALYFICLAIGWGLPLVLTVIYAAVRATQPFRVIECWIHEDSLMWIMFGPVVISVVVNIFILTNIIRLLLTKLRQVPEASQGKKAARATLILVPLFGLQFLIMPVKPPEGTLLLEIYHWFAAIVSSLQGLMVSIMFCFCNGEVTSIVRRKWEQHRLMTSGRRKHTGLSTTYTEAYSVAHTSNKDLSGQRARLPQDSVELKPLKCNSDGSHA